MTIQRAQPTDAPQLTALAMRSKDHWDYGPDQIHAWEEDLTVTPEYIAANGVYQLTQGDNLIGFYAFQPQSETVVKLTFLFVDPQYIGHGHGKRLLEDFWQRMEGTPYQQVVLDADPNAAPFYQRLGFEVIGQLPSSIEGRFLPIMAKALRSQSDQ